MESPGQAGLVSPLSGGCQWWESWAKVPNSSTELQSPSMAKPCGISIPRVAWWVVVAHAAAEHSPGTGTAGALSNTE